MDFFSILVWLVFLVAPILTGILAMQQAKTNPNAIFDEQKKRMAQERFDFWRESEENMLQMIEDQRKRDDNQQYYDSLISRDI